MKKIILISGKAENGKTTAAKQMKKVFESRGYRAVITRYAKYLKEIAKDYCGWDGNKDEKGRKLLQELGTDIIRNKLNKPDFHVGRICEDIEVCADYVDYVIIDDTRFPNEIYYPLAKFGKDKIVTYKVNRIELVDADSYENTLSEVEQNNMRPYQNSLTPEQRKHPTETALDDYDDLFDYNLIITSLENALAVATAIANDIMDDDERGL